MGEVTLRLGHEQPEGPATGEEAACPFGRRAGRDQIAAAVLEILGEADPGLDGGTSSPDRRALPRGARLVETAGPHEQPRPFETEHGRVERP
jgi:hypothetical protein